MWFAVLICGRPQTFFRPPFFIEGPENIDVSLRPVGDSNDSFTMSSEG